MSQELDRLAALQQERNKASADYTAAVNAIASARSTMNAALARRDSFRPIQKEKRAEQQAIIDAQDLIIAQQETIRNEAEKKIPILDLEMSTLRRALEARAAATTTLADKGISVDALEIEAKGRADAQLVTAQAQAQAIQDKSTAETTDSKKRRNIIIAVCVIVALILLVFIYFKFIKK